MGQRYGITLALANMLLSAHCLFCHDWLLPLYRGLYAFGAIYFSICITAYLPSNSQISPSGFGSLTCSSLIGVRPDRVAASLKSKVQPMMNNNLCLELQATNKKKRSWLWIFVDPGLWVFIDPGLWMGLCISNFIMRVFHIESCQSTQIALSR